MLENKMQVFENDLFGKVGVVMINDKPYFPATKCAKILGYAKPEDAVARHCRYSVKHGVTDNLGRDREANFISEGDLYRLIIRSKLPEAENFEKWIFDSVIPAIRRQGMYVTESALREMLQSSGLLAERRPNLSEYNKMARLIIGVMKDANVPPEQIAENIAKLYEPIGIPVCLDNAGGEKTYSASEIARINGMMSLTGKPHHHAAGTVISILKIDDRHKIIKPYQNGDNTVLSVRYDKYVLDAVSSWIYENNYPREISSSLKTYKVKYKHQEDTEDCK
jgi:prophage antirepressor-like protein